MVALGEYGAVSAFIRRPSLLTRIFGGSMSLPTTGGGGQGTVLSLLAVLGSGWADGS
jgi:hypothetical protein